LIKKQQKSRNIARKEIRFSVDYPIISDAEQRAKQK